MLGAGTFFALLAAATPQPTRALCGLLAGMAVPVVLLVLGFRIRLGLGPSAATGFALAAVAAFWSLASFGLLAAGVGPNRIVTTLVAVVLQGGCAVPTLPARLLRQR